MSDQSYMNGYNDGYSDCDCEWKCDYDKLEEQLKEARDYIDQINMYIPKVGESSYAKLVDRVKEAESVIEFYGNPLTYDFDSNCVDNDSEVISYCDDTREWELGAHSHYPYNDFCGGKTARQYLAKYKTSE